MIELDLMLELEVRAPTAELEAVELGVAKLVDVVQSSEVEDEQDATLEDLELKEVRAPRAELKAVEFVTGEE